MITKNFINQCEQAEEIQREWTPDYGDWIFLNSLRKIVLISNQYPPIRYYRNESIWLPTQEQLWAMIQNETYRLRIEKFEEDISIECFFKNKVEDSYYVTGRLKLKGKNFEELLLQIVMYRKYSKSWTGKKWEVIE